MDHIPPCPIKVEDTNNTLSMSMDENTSQTSYPGLFNVIDQEKNLSLPIFDDKEPNSVSICPTVRLINMFLKDCLISCETVRLAN